jgi:hypothetical protein
MSCTIARTLYNSIRKGDLFYNSKIAEFLYILHFMLFVLILTNVVNTHASHGGYSGFKNYFCEDQASLCPGRGSEYKSEAMPRSVPCCCIVGK